MFVKHAIQYMGKHHAYTYTNTAYAYTGKIYYTLS